MTRTPTARERARAALTGDILDEARRQLLAHGADGMSLRAVARALGLASSALYRYFPSRDELLTALIIDAYDAIGAEVEQAVESRPALDHLGRWRSACGAVRTWARDHPHEYALIYGSPIPGYRAPVATVGSAARVPTALFEVVRDCHRAGRLPEPPDMLMPPAPADARRQFELLVEAAGIPGLEEVPHATLAAVYIAWTQLFGMVSFELFGHLEGIFDDKAALFDHCVDRLAHLIGLPGS